MGGLDPSVEATLDALVPPRPHPDRWPAVVADAGRRKRARVLLLSIAPVGVVAAAAAVLVLAWPFASGPSGTILQRAAAAIGDGPVLHAVIRSGWGGTLIDLRSGARRQMHGEDELWYDAQRGVRDVSLFDGVVQSEAVYPPGRVGYLKKTLAGLATGYRKALSDGSARVLGTDVIDSVPVYWIRVDTQLLPDSGDNKLHEWAHDVAVSQSDYRPVATRETRDGKPGPDGNSTIVSVETLPAGAGDFARTTPDLNGVAMSSRRVGLLTPGEASAALGVEALWAGPRVAGLQLAQIWKDVRTEGYNRQSGGWDKTFTGVSLWYGELDTSFPGAFPAGAVSKPFVRVSESLTLDTGFQRGVLGYSPPKGSVLVFGGRIGVMQAAGVHIALEAYSENILIEAAKALRPISP